MAWLPHGEKNFEDIFIRFGATHERDRRTDRQTDGQTPHADIYRAYAYASRGKNGVITSDNGGGKCVCPRSFVCLSVSKITQKRAHGFG